MAIADPELLDRLPPCNVEAERAVLGSALLRPDVLDDVVPLLVPADFYESANGEMFRLLSSMHGTGRRIDAVLLAKEAKQAGVFEGIGGAAYVAEVMQASPTAANAVYYAGIVRDAALRRSLIHSGSRVLQLGYDASVDTGEMIDTAERLVLEVRDRHAATASRAIDVGILLQESMASLDARKQGEVFGGVASGFTDLDPLMGFKKSEFLILAARPSMGKTALALNIAANVAMAGNPVVFFSLEMSAAQVGDRLLSSVAEVDGERLSSGMLSQGERSSIVAAAAELSQSKLVIDDSPRLSVQDMAAVCRRQKRRHGLALAIVDYLQLVHPENTRDPREQQVATISKRLKQLARELDVPVMCLAQLNREVEKSADKRPRLSHLRESGAVEQDADVVAFVHRPEYFETDPQRKRELKGIAEVIVAKNRNGRTGDVRLTWRAPFVKFGGYVPDPRDSANYDPSFDAYNNSSEF